jgi:hypothetical protein
LEEAAIPLKVDADNSLSDHPALKLMSGILSLRQGDYAVATEYLFMQAVDGIGGVLLPC